MAYWNDPRYRVLKKYGILIDAAPEVLERLPGQLPPVEGDMTFHQWKLSVFGEAVDVGIFSLEWPYGNTRMKTLSGWGGEHVKQLLRHQTKVARKHKQAEMDALELALAEVAGEAHVPKELLEAEVDDLGNSLQPSVQEFFARELENVDDDVSVEQLLQKMLRFMNAAAAGFAQCQQRVEQQEKQLEQLHRQGQPPKAPLDDQGAL